MKEMYSEANCHKNIDKIALMRYSANGFLPNTIYIQSI